jgi:predicted MFS family arabinose efflux permease
MNDAPAPVREPSPPAERLSSQRILTTIWLAVFSTSLFFRAVDPIIPQIAADLHEPASSVALLATAFALPYALIQPILGAAADVFGKTRMMFACLVLVTIATFAGAFAPNLTTLMGARVVSGIVSGGLFPISLALVAQVVTVNERQVAISRLLAGAMLGQLLGAATSGAVSDFFGWRGVFVVNGTFAALAMVTAFVGFGGPGRKPPTSVDFRSIPASYRAIFTNPQAKFCFGAVLLEGMFLFGMFPFVAPKLHDAGITSGTISGLVIGGFGVGGILYAFVIAFLLRQLGQQKLMVLGGGLMGLGLILMALKPPWQAQVAIFLMFGLSFYLLHGVIQIFVTELAPSARGTAAAVHSTFFFFGQSIGPIYYRTSFAEIGEATPLIFGGCVLIATGLVCAKFLHHRPRYGATP